MLSGLEGVVYLIDDVLIYAGDEQQHDARLIKSVLQRIASAGTTLNTDKCSFRQCQIKFLGHILNENGVSADPEKLKQSRTCLLPRRSQVSGTS